MLLRTLLLAAAVLAYAATHFHAQASREAASEVERVIASSAYKPSAGLRE
jgi:outer membrane lipopolysaccharide assembly protein LptE/RlpB